MRPEWARRAVCRSGRLDLVLWWLVWMPFRARVRRFAKWLCEKTEAGDEDCLFARVDALAWQRYSWRAREADRLLVGRGTKIDFVYEEIAF